MNNDSFLINLALSMGSMLPLDTVNKITIPDLKIMGIWKDYEIFGFETKENPGGEPLVQTENYNIFVAKLPNNQLGLMKTNRNSEGFKLLESESKAISLLQALADDIDSKYSESEKIFYDVMFPKVIEIIKPNSETINVFLGYHSKIKSYDEFVPLTSALEGNKFRVDLKTAHWIFGKSLKFMNFLHQFGHLALGFVDASNLFIEVNHHGVFWFDFTRVSNNPTPEQCKYELMALAAIIWNATGGDDKNFPYNEPGIFSSEDDYNRYVSFLRKVMIGSFADAKYVKDKIYEIGDEVWPKVPIVDKPGQTKRQFHHFQKYNR